MMRSREIRRTNEQEPHMPTTPTAYISTRKVGEAEITLILEGVGSYGVELNVPEEVWRPETLEADPAGKVTLASGGALIRLGDALIVMDRSEERRVGKECTSTVTSWETT